MTPPPNVDREPFEPTDYGFVLLPQINPQGVEHYELNNHKGVDGTHDFSRMNVYLARDEDFINIWHGAIESFGMQMFLEKHGVDYAPGEDKLFRGYITTRKEADIILPALRYEKMLASAYILNENGKLINELLK